MSDYHFGLGSKSFAHISSDNRIHLWDIVTRQEKRSYVDKNHLSHEFTCFTWKHGPKERLGHAVVGYSDGLTMVWDLTRGVVVKTIGTVGESVVPTAVAISNDASSVYVGSAEEDIVEFSLLSGEVVRKLKSAKKGVQRMALNPKAEVLAISSGSSIKLVDVNSDQKRKLEGSFQGGCSALSFTPCGKYLVGSSNRNREVLVFDVRADASSEPMCVVPVTGLPLSIDVNSTKKNGTIEILCVYEGGGSSVYTINTGSGGVDCSIEETKLNFSSTIIGGVFQATGLLLLAVGAKSNPTFVHIETRNASGAVLSSVDIDSHPSILEFAVKGNNSINAGVGGNAGAAATKYSQQQQEALVGPDILGPNQMGGMKRPIAADENEDDVDSSSTRKIGRTADKSSEMTLEQQLEQLTREADEAEEDEEDAANSSGAAVSALQNPTSDSLVTLIDQSLQSGDDALLEQCLNCTEKDVVDATAARLPTNRVVMLLRKLVAKFEKRPSRGGLLTQWLASVLRHHTSFLVTVPDLSFQLAGLSQMLEQRLASYSKLASLSGRLDLLMSQVAYPSSVKGVSSKQQSVDSIEPLQVYNEF